MTIKSKQLSKIVSHYIENWGHSGLDSLIEVFNTDTEDRSISIEDLGVLGKAFHITGFGSYVVSDSENVLFLKNI